MAKQRIYLSPPHLGKAELRYVKEAFQSNWIAPMGPHVDAFEKEVAGYVGVSAGLALSSGTSAIHLALRLLNVGRGDQVMCSSFTFIGSANPILYEGAEPVFIDSEPSTWNMSPAALKRALEASARRNRLPKAVILVELYGQSADMDSILAICDSFGVPIIEDTAESLGATYRKRQCGSFGKFSILSFNGNKIITTSGGGMLLSNDEKALQRARHLSAQARDPAPHYQHSEIGYNYRMSNVLAAIGRGQLRALDDRVEKRRAIFERYRTALGHLPGVGFMPEPKDSRGTRWLSVMTLDPQQTRVSPMMVVQSLNAAGIEARPVWKPLHLQPLFTGTPYYSHEPGNSFCEELFRTAVCLPSGSSLAIKDQKRVIKVIESVLEQSRAIAA
jgi:pyridoxal phosphate-dependent aminotransferase EpsN